MKIVYWGIIMLLCLCGCTYDTGYVGLQDILTEYCNDKDAKIGIGVIIDGKDTVAVNGDKPFPMLSVYKFPIALSLGEYCRTHNMSLNHQVAIKREDLHLDTYSPMTEKILASSQMMTEPLHLPLSEILAYMLQQSDNNASDIALREAGGVGRVSEYLKRLGINDVNVNSSEAEMHVDNSLCYVNSATPLAMAELLYKFDVEYSDPISHGIKNLMESCSTGRDRLVKPLVDKSIVVGHKTGTGFMLPDGRLMAVNDVGYVHLPDGRRYAIAVFVEDSGYDMAHTEALIAEISGIVYQSIVNEDK